MKSLINQVDLQIFESRGRYGLTHKETWSPKYMSGFDPFYNGFLIFHDIFEHYFEFKHPYFLNEAAMNVGGEICAMGHAYYYLFDMGISERWSNNYLNINIDDIFIDWVRKVITENCFATINHGNIKFGEELVCHVPNQPQTDEWVLEMCGIESFKTCQEQYFNGNYGFDTFKGARNASKKFKDSLTERKILNLLRYGYNQARQLVPNNLENCRMLVDFIEFWDRFCDNNRGSHLIKIADGIRFNVYRGNDKISWDALVKPKNGDEYSYLVDSDRQIMEINNQTAIFNT